MDSISPELVERCPIFKRFTGPIHVCHRGGAAAFGPENTLYNYRRCFHEVKTDMVEIDVARTKDGHLVIMHDWSVDRTTNGTGKVSEHTLAEIKSLDAAYNWTPDHTTYPLRGQGIQVPTVLEVMEEFASDDGCMFFFDLKEKEAVKDVFEIIQKYSLQHRCMVGAVFPAVNAEMMRLKPPCIPATPDVKTMAKLFIAFKFHLLWAVSFKHEIVGWVFPVRPTMLNILMSPKLVSAFKAKAHGVFAVFGTALNTRHGIEHALACGADMILSDLPMLLRDTIAERNKLSAKAKDYEPALVQEFTTKQELESASDIEKAFTELATS